jgi:hypothetical protein
MVKYKDIEFSTIFSQEIIKNKLEKIICSDSLFDKDYHSKGLTGTINLYGFTIHNIKSIFMYRTINYWRILIKGKMTNDNNLTNIKMRIRILHGEIIYMYLFFLIFAMIFSENFLGTIFPIITFIVIFLILTFISFFKIRNIDNEIKYYEKLLIKTIIE